jgi:hypothetical protein
MVYIPEILHRNFPDVLVLSIPAETFRSPSQLHLEKVKNVWGFKSTPLFIT